MNADNLLVLQYFRNGAILNIQIMACSL